MHIIALPHFNRLLENITFILPKTKKTKPIIAIIQFSNTDFEVLSSIDIQTDWAHPNNFTRDYPYIHQKCSRDINLQMFQHKIICSICCLSNGNKTIRAINICHCISAIPKQLHHTRLSTLCMTFKRTTDFLCFSHVIYILLEKNVDKIKNIIMSSEIRERMQVIERMAPRGGPSIRTSPINVENMTPSRLV